MYEDYIYEKAFSNRLAQIRTKRGVSARDMSLSLGQNPGYINTIENGKAFPTMKNFFYICEFLHITPKEFFDVDMETLETTNTLKTDTAKISPLTEQLNQLEKRQLDIITALVNELLRK